MLGPERRRRRASAGSPALLESDTTGDVGLARDDVDRQLDRPAVGALPLDA
jgi:hypothetical protein